MQKFNRRHCLHLGLAAALVAGTSAFAQSASFPSKPITLVVPYAAGGLTDQLAREVGVYMTAQLKQPVVVENRPGGAAQIAMNFLKNAPADGHTVFFGDVPSLATNVGLFPKLNYDPRKDVQLLPWSWCPTTAQSKALKTWSRLPRPSPMR